MKRKALAATYKTIPKFVSRHRAKAYGSPPEFHQLIDPSLSRRFFAYRDSDPYHLTSSEDEEQAEEEPDSELEFIQDEEASVIDVLDETPFDEGAWQDVTGSQRIAIRGDKREMRRRLRRKSRDDRQATFNSLRKATPKNNCNRNFATELDAFERLIDSHISESPTFDEVSAYRRGRVKDLSFCNFSRFLPPLERASEMFFARMWVPKQPIETPKRAYYYWRMPRLSVLISVIFVILLVETSRRIIFK